MYVIRRHVTAHPLPNGAPAWPNAPASKSLATEPSTRTTGLTYIGQAQTRNHAQPSVLVPCSHVYVYVITYIIT